DRGDGRRTPCRRLAGAAHPPVALQGQRHAAVARAPAPDDRGGGRVRRRRGASTAELEPLTVLGVLLAAQGLVGSVQYELKLPSDMVWVHVTLATITWMVVLWVVAAEGRLAPSSAPVPAAQAPASARELEPVGG